MNQNIAKDGISFRITPSLEDVKKEYQVFFILEDAHPNNPLEREYTFQVIVSEVFDVNYSF